MKRFLLIVSLGVTLASGADAELNHEEVEKVRRLYDNLKVSDNNFEYMSIDEQADFIFYGLQEHEFNPSREDILSAIKGKKGLINNEVSEEDKRYIKHLHKIISASDPAYKLLDTDRQLPTIIEAFKKLKPEANLTENEIRKTFYAFKNEIHNKREKKEKIKHVYGLLYSSDPSFRFLDIKAKSKDVYNFCKRLNPSLDITENDVHHIVSKIKNEDNHSLSAIKDGKIHPFQAAHKAPDLNLNDKPHSSSHASSSSISPRKAG